ncbi:MAG: sulfite exporter TauE/SafE family protein [Bacillota bacterium]
MEFLIILLAGWGAGIITGLVGASAVVIVTPILITFLGYSPYTAIGISLATDVIASSVSAITYKKHGNIDLKNGLGIAFTTVTAALIGSYFSEGVNPNALGGLSGLMIIFMGVSFTKNTLNEQIENFKEKFNLSFFRDHKVLSSILAGTYIGLFSGFLGAGGGIMILVILTFVLEYKLHMAIGTSVLIMTFTALSGAGGHFFFEQSIPYWELAISSSGAFIGAYLAAHYANEISEKKLSKAIGVVFIILGGISTYQQFFLS